MILAMIHSENHQHPTHESDICEATKCDLEINNTNHPGMNSLYMAAVPRCLKEF
jgi:hypothetical protein